MDGGEYPPSNLKSLILYDMKKESFDIVADLFAIAMASCNKENGSGTIEAKVLIDHLTRMTTIEMTNEKIGKLNVWDFVESDKTRVASSIYHKDGFLCATNRRMLLRVKRDYAPEVEGRCMKKDGSLTSGCLTGFDDAVIRNKALHREGGKKVKIDFDKFAEISKACKACGKISKGKVRPVVSLDGGSMHFYYDELVSAVQYMADAGVDEISIIPNKRYPAMIESGEDICLLMPVEGDFRQMMYVWEM